MSRRFVFLLCCISLFLCMTGALQAQSTQSRDMSIASFEYIPNDLTARQSETMKKDAEGRLMSIIKVRTNDPKDDLTAYEFDFGYMEDITEVRNDDREIWVYVQRGAKHITISRSGYKTIKNRDLGVTLETGKVYELELSVAPRVIKKRMLLFKVSPAGSEALVTYKAEGDAGDYKPFGSGRIDEGGMVAKNLEPGIYVYKVISTNYHSIEGRIILEDVAGKFVEPVILKPNYGTLSLAAAQGVDIYIDGEKMGTGSWNGNLSPGFYNIECRKERHRSTVESVEVKEGETKNITLKAPEPITGSLALMSTPLGVNVAIDGKPVGSTPDNFSGLLIGSHEVKLSKDGYRTETKTIEIKENKTTECEVALVKVVQDGAAGAKNNHGYVDLGLPSGLLWATCNVGASKPEEYGDYYAWGEIETNSGYTQGNCKTYGKDIGDISGNPAYDVARANWGGKWRMPTENEFKELIDNCKWEWTTINGKNGYKVTSKKNGNSIFLPAAYGTSRVDGTYSYYWSSTPDGTDCAYHLRLGWSSQDTSHNYRYYGHVVRPVTLKLETNISAANKAAIACEYVDLGLSVKWATCNVGASKPEEYGNYYAWGEINTKDNYSESTSLTYVMELGDISGNPQYDAATANWGGKWRMPTKEEFQELMDNCKWKWTRINGIKGYKVTSKKNGNSIFLPAAGYRYGTPLYYGGSFGYYWSSSPDDTINAYRLYFHSGYHSTVWDNRYCGRSVRPVSE